MISTWSKIVLAATPENAVGASAVVHLAALAVLATWTFGTVSNPPRLGGSYPAIQLDLEITDPEPDPMGVKIVVREPPPLTPPPRPEIIQRRLTTAVTLPLPDDDRVALVEELVPEPILVRPRVIARNNPSRAEQQQTRTTSAIPLRVPRRRPARPEPPTLTVSHERIPPEFPGQGALNYPEQARRLGLEGRVLLRLSVNAEGRVTRVDIIRSSGHAILDESAARWVRRWHGEPARIGGRPAASVEILPIRFRLN